MLGLRSLLPAAALLSIVTACGVPPKPAAEHAPPPTAAASAPLVEQRCGLVRRAKRTWVGFAEGMTLDDMLPAGQAAGEVVRALDATLCGLSHGEQPAALREERVALQRSTARGAKFEVTKVLWQDPGLTRAQVEMHEQSSADAGWLASVVRVGERGWQIETFDSH